MFLGTLNFGQQDPQIFGNSLLPSFDETFTSNAEVLQSGLPFGTCSL